MKYLSLCSGIEAATVAWHPLGWEAVAYSEIERFPSEVLAHHYPSTPNLGDMTKFKEWNFESDVDLLVGGTPCQSFSVAGLRKGLDDPRGNLMLTYLAIADKYKPQWIVWENVPGVLSSNGGKDFGVFLGALGELGYGFAYRILDAQYFGVAQRRRRVFVVGHLGDWRAAAAVLFERHSLQGHPAPSREKGQVTPTLTKEGTGVSRTGHNEDGWYVETPVVAGSFDTECGGGKLSHQTVANGHLIQTKGDRHAVAQPISFDMAQITSKVNRTKVEQGLPVSTLAKGSQMHVAQPIAFSGQMSNPQTDVDMTQTLQAKNPMAVCLMDQGGSVMNIENDMTGTLRRETHGHEPIVMQPVGTGIYNGSITGDVAVPLTNRSDGTGTGPTVMQSMAVCLGGQHPNAGIGIEQSPTLTNAMGAGGGHVPITNAMAVRRLTPVECERLQGFGDNYTDIKSKEQANA
jgi:DNA (cytosine-5)-methyltransferase 1